MRPALVQPLQDLAHHPNIGRLRIHAGLERGERLPSETAAVVSEQGAPSTQCVIKGNINREGTRIYHTPRSRHYERTQIDESAGERWFCSEAEAQAAGWRPPRG